MSEIRQALPYVSRIKYTVRTSTRLDPIRDLEDGRTLMAVNADLPGLVIVVVPFLTPTLPMDPEIYEFKRKSFYQDELAALKAIESPSEEQLKAIQIVENLLETHKLWEEDLLEKAGIENLSQEWAPAFSEALDEFPEWKEPETQIGGLPVSIYQNRWDAQLPWVGEKKIEVTIGAYKNNDLRLKPTEQVLIFEDGATKRRREAELASIQKDLEATTKVIALLPEIDALRKSTTTENKTLLEARYSEYPVLRGQKDLDEFKALLENQKTMQTQNLERLQSATYGSLPKILSNSKVLASSQKIVFAGLASLKESNPFYANLDMALVASRYSLPDVS